MSFISGFLAAIAGDMLGDAVSKGAAKENAAKIAASLTSKGADLLREKMEAEKFDRDLFLTTLLVINSETDGGVQEILDLFLEFQKSGGVLRVGEKFYRENWTGAMLQKIELADRSWVWQFLDKELGKDRENFFALLELMNNDNLAQTIRQSGLWFDQSELGKSVATAADELADSLEAITGPGGSLRNFRDRLRARATETKKKEKS